MLYEAKLNDVKTTVIDHRVTVNVPHWSRGDIMLFIIVSTTTAHMVVFLMYILCPIEGQSTWSKQ